MGERKVLCSSFMRFQEFYESPYEDIHGKVFTREYFKKVYTKQMKRDRFTYFEDWAGFNVPGHVFEIFFAGKFDPMLECEKKLLNLVKPYKDNKFCVIGTIDDDEECLMHELSHAFWYTIDDYKQRQLEQLSKINKTEKEKLRKVLLEYGYNEHVILDEMCAYLITDLDDMSNKGINTIKLKTAVSNMTRNFNDIARNLKLSLLDGGV